MANQKIDPVIFSAIRSVVVDWVDDLFIITDEDDVYEKTVVEHKDIQDLISALNEKGLFVFFIHPTPQNISVSELSVSTLNS